MLRRSSLVLAFLLGFVGCSRSMAEEGRPPNNEERPPRRDGDGERAQPSRAKDLELVKNILAKYDPKSLTAADARAIHAAFRDAGLRAGPALNDAVKAAGFDPDRLRDLDPPPARPQKN